MAALTPEQESLARHALGLPNDRRRSYRNRYLTAPMSEAWFSWAQLVDRGLASVIPSDPASPSRLEMFSLTRTGAEAVLAAGESLDLEDFPHD